MFSGPVSFFLLFELDQSAFRSCELVELCLILVTTALESTRRFIIMVA